MKTFNRNLKNLFQCITFIALLFGSLISCSTPVNELDPNSLTPVSSTQQSIKGHQAELIFLVRLPPANLDFEVPIYLDMLDEVTGLSINPQRYKLDRIDNQNYRVSINKTIGSVIKYRYVQGDLSSNIEHTLDGKQIEFRAYPVTGPDLIEDHIISWSPLPRSGPVGRIQGLITDSDNNPIINAMIGIAGQTTLSSAEGSFLIENVPEGRHLLTAFALDGRYQPFHQYAEIKDQATTPADYPVGTINNGKYYLPGGWT